MILDNEARQELQLLLSAELRCACELQRTLDREHAVLLKGDAQSIQEITVEKQQQMQRLQEQIILRDQLLQKLSLPMGMEGLQKLPALFPEESKISSQLDELQQTARGLKEKNEINGGLVTLGYRHVQQALDLLVGKSGSDTTYGPKGGHRTTIQATSLAKA